MFESPPFSLSPIEFFAISYECRYLPKAERLSWDRELPGTGALCHECNFAKMAMGWHEEGLSFLAQVNQPAVRSACPNVSKGDSVEIFIDTRDVKTSGFNTRFCHHFFFLPQAVELISCGEATHFRTEDENHPLCDPKALQLETQLKKDSYHMKIFIPSQCLYGYDPGQVAKLGFTYRINRAGGHPQHFSVVTQDFQLEQQPSLWASIHLVR